MKHQPLDDLELDFLETFLDSDQVHEDCQNFVMAHGFLTALAIAPHSPKPEQWLPIVFEETPKFQDTKEQERVETLLKRLAVDIQIELESEDEFLVPCDMEIGNYGEELTELQEWATGFMEGVFLTDIQWFEHEQEELIAQLLLPIMVASDLFDDEEVVQIRQEAKTTQSCIEQIPHVLTDLFLTLRTEPEKKAKPVTRKPAQNKGKNNQKKKKR